MNDITKLLPITLIDLLNSFNEELSKFRREIKMDSNIQKVTFSNTTFDNVKIKYSLKNTSFYFEISFLIKGDYIDWNYYPHKKDSTKSNKTKRMSVSTSAYSELNSNFISWKNIITKITTLVSPLDYFNSDNFIEFYSAEILEQIPTTDLEEKYPLSKAKQTIAIELINKQRNFIKKEKERIEDKESEEYFDFEIADKSLIELRENIPRMTVAEVKRKWSIPIGVIMKWCGDKFMKYLKVDRESGYDVSRAIGSFFGGLFGFPKLDQ